MKIKSRIDPSLFGGISSHGRGCSRSHLIQINDGRTFCPVHLNLMFSSHIYGSSKNKLKPFEFVVDPNEIRFKRASCFDVGLECGGWGKTIRSLRLKKKNHLKSLL